MKIELNEFELEMIRDALNDKRESIRGYIKWIDDRPMLPAREVAVEALWAEYRRALALVVKLYELQRPEHYEGVRGDG